MELKDNGDIPKVLMTASFLISPVDQTGVSVESVEASHCLRYRFQSSGIGESWVPMGKRWQTAGDSWLVAHDMYHHSPNDKGTLAEEFASLGAEYYVCHEQALSTTSAHAEIPGMSALANCSASVVGIAWDANTSPRHFKLKHVEAPLLSASTEEVIAKAEASAIAELQYLASVGSDTTDPWFAAMKVFSTPGRISGWIRKGYWEAAARFPDQGAARKGFEQLVQELKSLECALLDDHVIHVQLDGARAEVELQPLSPRAQSKYRRRLQLHVLIDFQVRRDFMGNEKH